MRAPAIPESLRKTLAALLLIAGGSLTFNYLFPPSDLLRLAISGVLPLAGFVLLAIAVISSRPRHSWLAMVAGAALLCLSGGLLALLIIEIEYSPTSGTQTFVPRLAKLYLALGGATGVLATALRRNRTLAEP